MTGQHSGGKSSPRPATGEWQSVLAATARLQHPKPLQTRVTGAGELKGALTALSTTVLAAFAGCMAWSCAAGTAPLAIPARTAPFSSTHRLFCLGLLCWLLCALSITSRKPPKESCTKAASTETVVCRWGHKHSA